MFLCLDIGNSHFYAGVFSSDKKLLLQFRYNCKHIGSSDQLGVFLRSVLRENGFSYHLIKKIGISSVVPSLDYTARATCIKYFNIDPQFLDSSLAGAVNIATENPQSLGADLLASAIAACQLKPNQDLLVFDFGTASTCLYLDVNHNLLGVAITAGVKIMMESLHQNTAKLSSVEIINNNNALGNNTQTAIQAGIFNSQMGFINNTITGVMQQYNLAQPPYIIATGGFAYLFNSHNVFNIIVPELVLIGILSILSF